MDYVDPDNLYEMASWIEQYASVRTRHAEGEDRPRRVTGTTFVYSFSNFLAISDVLDIHSNLISQYGEQLYPGIWDDRLSVDYYEDPEPVEEFRLNQAQQYSLLGRIGLGLPGYDMRQIVIRHSLPKVWGRIKDKVKTIVSFWNDTPEIYAELLAPCMLELEKRGLVPADAYISTPLMGSRPIKASATKPISAPTQGTALDQAARERLRKRQELHVMRPDAKKAAMKELGLAEPKGPHPWQQEPGQKWWAMQSDSVVKNIANLITDDPDVFSPSEPEV